VEPTTYLSRARQYAEALRTYRTYHNGITGFDVWPAPKPTDRYYDDNAWAALAYLELYDLTHDERDRTSAEEAYRFALHGEDEMAGGGLYWHEDKRESKHACSSAPAIVAALKLYRMTDEGHYLATGMRLYEWMNAKLQDHNGLFCDSVRVKDGSVDRNKWSYNSAMMIIANCLLYDIRGHERYLREARRIARSAEEHWVRAEDGLIADDAKFAHKLIESFLTLYARDHDQHWLSVVGRCLDSLYHKGRDPQGWYAMRWDIVCPASLDPIRLVDQASAARAYWVAAVRLTQFRQ
jgi:predicted alpha-1,6-mannanase (GH76 family)